MTNDTDYRGKLRAVFLAAIMVVSVFGAGVAFTGSAAATANSIDTITDQNPDAGSISITVNHDDNTNQLSVALDTDGNDEADLSTSVGDPSGSTSTTLTLDASSSSSGDFSAGDLSAGQIDVFAAQGSSADLSGSTSLTSEADVGPQSFNLVSADDALQQANNVPSQVSPGETLSNVVVEIENTNSNVDFSTSSTASDITVSVGTSSADAAVTSQTFSAGTTTSVTFNDLTVPVSSGQFDLDISVDTVSGSSATFTQPNAVTVGSTASNVNYNPADQVFQGQNVIVSGGDIDATSNNGFAVRQVDSFTTDQNGNSIVESSSLAFQVDDGDIDDQGTSSPSDDEVLVDTDDLESGQYFLRDDNGNLPTNPAASNLFEVTVQDLSAPFAEDDQPALTDSLADSQVNLDMASGRAVYSVNVSANGNLDNEELFNLFVTESLNNNPEILASGTPSSLTDPSSSSSINNGVYVNVTNEGNLDIFDGEGDQLEFDANGDNFNDGDTATGLTPFQLYVDSSFNVGTFSSGTDFTHDGDSITNAPGTGVSSPADTFNIGSSSYEVGLYQNGQDSDEVPDFDDKIVLFETGDIDEDISAVGQDEGTYDFTFGVTDTETEATTSLELLEQDLGASFEDGVATAGAGDIAEFSVTLEDSDDTYVQIGDESSDFVEVLYLEADDEGEPMTIQVNTRILGTDLSPSATNQDAVNQVYDTDNVETIESEIYSNGGNGISPANQPSIPLYEDDGTLADNGDPGLFDDYLDAMEIININNNEQPTDQLIRPLQATDYSVTVAGDSTDNDAVFDADPGGEANEQLASAVLQLQQPAIGDITTHTAPEGNADDVTNVSELVDVATPREEVAVDDRAIIQVEATGLYGSLVYGADGSPSADNTDYDRLTDGMSTQVLNNLEENSNESVTFEVTAEDSTGNQDPLEVDLTASDTETYVVLDNDNGQFFVVVDTSSDQAFDNGDAPDEAVEFTAELEYDADNGDERFEFANDKNPFSQQGEDSGSDYTNYPYLDEGEVLSTTQGVTLAPREINFDNVNEDDVVQVENTADAVVSGTTNVAPGSDATIRADSTNASSSFRQGNDVNITDDGSIETTFDLSSQEVGDEFDLNYQVEGGSISSTNSVAVEEGTLSTSETADEEEEETNETETDDGEADDGEEQPADDGEMNESTDDGSTDDGTPGFGAVVALVALIGAALLAVRRQN